MLKFMYTVYAVVIAIQFITVRHAVLCYTPFLGVEKAELCCCFLIYGGELLNC
jgi:hypothetical protein